MTIYLASTVLQTSQISIDLSVLAILVSSATAIILVFMVMITWKNIRENTKATYSQLLRGFHEDLTTRLNKNSVLRTTEDCERYANDYLNTVDERLQERIPDWLWHGGKRRSCVHHTGNRTFYKHSK